jgi:DNA invertase Pin-like site-specific DNA recombinase
MYSVRMSRRRLRRKVAKAQRHAKAQSAALPDPLGLTVESFGPAAAVIEEPARVVVREASEVERLAYTRAQAARALGIGRSTFTQRVLPYVETVETPWGTKLIPADELERVLLEWRRPARPRRKPERTGRPPAVAPEVIQRIRDARDAGLSLRQIADRLNADGTPTAHGGAQWWASTVRSVLGG